MDRVDRLKELLSEIGINSKAELEIAIAESKPIDIAVFTVKPQKARKNGGRKNDNQNFGTDSRHAGA